MALVPHRCGERQRLATTAGAQVDDTLAGLRNSGEADDLAAGILDLDLAGIGIDVGAGRQAKRIGHARDRFAIQG